MLFKKYILDSWQFRNKSRLETNFLQVGSLQNQNIAKSFLFYSHESSSWRKASKADYKISLHKVGICILTNQNEVFRTVSCVKLAPGSIFNDQENEKIFQNTEYNLWNLFWCNILILNFDFHPAISIQ